MKKPSNWDDVKATAGRQVLPADAYECKVLDAEVVSYRKGSPDEFKMLAVSFDITSGEYAGHYKQDYQSQTHEDKKWRGTLRQFLPKDDGSDKDEWTKSSLKAMTEAFEESNSGYHWDWDEKSLKGKVIGCLFRNEEWSFNGNTGWKVQPFLFLDIERVKKGDYKIPNEKPLANKSPANTQGYTDVENDGDLPF